MILRSGETVRGRLGSSNDSGLIDSLATIDNFGSAPWTLNNKLHKLRAYHAQALDDTGRRIMADLSGRGCHETGMRSNTVETLFSANSLPDKHIIYDEQRESD